MYDYPVYVDELKIGRRRVYIVGTPYVDLNREIWRETNLATDVISFLATSIENLFRDILRRSPKNIDEALDSGSTMTLLRAARVNFADDPNLRGAILVGENIMQSRLYKHLSPRIGGGTAIWLADAVAKIGFWGTSRRRVVIQMDRFGNFRLRPGIGGNRFPFFKEFLAHLSKIDGMNWRSQLPSDHVLSLAGETNS
jgi:hypothetical protein